jgi:hypothetical protein
MKTCTKCKIPKEFKLFYKNKSKKDGYQDLCIDCKKEQDKKHWKKHSKKWLKHYALKQKEVNEFYINYKKTLSCLKCNESRYWLLDFHHKDPSKKEFELSQIWNIKSFEKEVKKCIPLCSNCHRDFHYQNKTNQISIEEYIK